ncbi:MAG: hypothetical protein QG656_846 [Candidatus Hydrogenedentes bacterium]|nr:hypothetical protein [Candidatus Hydrogenedentota bacterium]
MPWKHCPDWVPAFAGMTEGCVIVDKTIDAYSFTSLRSGLLIHEPRAAIEPRGVFVNLRVRDQVAA